ncbi:MAG: hypothetical protein AVDCRST_MAG45-1222, partial [uncultured Solirubrobacterales bacterium]
GHLPGPGCALGPGVEGPDRGADRRGTRRLLPAAPAARKDRHPARRARQPPADEARERRADHHRGRRPAADRDPRRPQRRGAGPRGV